MYLTLIFIRLVKHSNVIPPYFSRVYLSIQAFGQHKFLIDGFPRNQDNLDGWNKEMAAKVNLKFVLFFECPDAVCIDRCLNRGTGRTDDNMDSLKKRFDVFHGETMPIVDYYEQKNLVRRVNGEKPAELVFDDVRQAFVDYDAK